MKPGKAAEIASNGADETISCYALRSEHQRSIRTNNPIERIMKRFGT